MSDLKQEAVVQGAAGTPPVLVTGAAMIGGLTLQEWVLAATLIYVVVQCGYLLWKWWREWRKSLREG